MPTITKIATHQNKSPWPFFSLAFRPFFWLGALFSIISVSVWGLSFTGHITFTPYGGLLFWHIHEMLFGFGVAIMVGFLLTATQSWTGLPTLKGKPLTALVMLWLAARILMAFPSLAPENFIMVIDLLFLPLAALALAGPILKAKMWKNVLFIIILLVMTNLNGLMHLSQPDAVTLSYIEIVHIMVLMMALVMCIIAGRVFPMFTANGTQTAKVLPLPWLEKLAIASVIASIIVSTGLIKDQPILEASLFFTAALSNFYRALRWRFWVTLSTPLLWSLHFSYFAVCSGFLMLGLTRLELLVNASLAYHAFTVGGMGLMILSMISRVSLGHTGRMIKVGKVMALAFSLMLLTFITRVFAPAFVDNYLNVILATTLLWAVAYSLFVVSYTPIVFKGRVDAK